MFENLTAMNQNHNCLLQNNFPGIIDNGETGMTWNYCSLLETCLVKILLAEQPGCFLLFSLG